MQAIPGHWGQIFNLAILVPLITVHVRRLHDIDWSGWWYLLWFAIIVGWIVVIRWAVTKGTEGPNRFGDDPLQPLGEDLKEVFS